MAQGKTRRWTKSMYECVLNSHIQSHLIWDQSDTAVVSGKDIIFDRWTERISIKKKN